MDSSSFAAASEVSTASALGKPAWGALLSAAATGASASPLTEPIMLVAATGSDVALGVAGVGKGTPWSSRYAENAWEKLARLAEALLVGLDPAAA